MSSSANEEETEELVAALSDDMDEVEEDEEDEEDEDALEEELEESDELHSCDERDNNSPHNRSDDGHDDEDDDDDDDDELQIAARAGIRLLEENMHFREEVLRLTEQITLLEHEKSEMQRALEDRDAQIASLSTHLRDSIRENQSVLSELSLAKDKLRGAEQEVAQLGLQRSPRRRASQRQSPRRSAKLSRLLVLDAFESASSEAGDAPASPSSFSAMSPASPTAQTAETSITMSPAKDAKEAHSLNEGRDSFADVVTSPRKRPSLARLKEIEAKYDDEHQRCNALRLELNFAQRRIQELKPLQSHLEEACHELETVRSRLVEVERQLQQSQAERAEEQELIQSLRQTIHVYEQLNDPRQRGSSMDHGRRLGDALQQDGARAGQSAERLGREDGGNSPAHHNEQLERLDRAAEMIDGRFNLREENERLLEQLKTLAEQVLQLTLEEPAAAPLDEAVEATSSQGRRFSVSRQRYLEQQVSVLQDLLRRFRLEWQHAHDARVCLEDEKTELLKLLDRQKAKLQQRTRSASISSRASVDHEQQQHQQREEKEEPVVAAEPRPERDGGPDDKDDDDGEDDSDDAAHERRLWARTNAICEALVRSSPALSKEEEAENELLCFALLRRLVDSWTTDKPKRMRLHDWLTNAIRHTGVRRPLYLHELSSEIAVGFQTLLVPILQEKFGVAVHVEKRLRNVIVTDLRIQVLEKDVAATPLSPTSAGRAQRVYHSLLSVIDGENGVQGGDEYHEWLGNYSARRASRSMLSK